MNARCIGYNCSIPVLFRSSSAIVPVYLHMNNTVVHSLRHQPKTQDVCARLTDMAHALGPDNKFPTVLELRNKMGVSLTTLNSALRALEASNVIYRIQGIGIFVSPSLQRHISLICTPDFFQQAGASPFWQLMIENARERAEAKNEIFSCHFAVPGGYKGAPLHAGLVRDINAREVHGVLGIGLGSETADWIEARDIPFVSFAGPSRWAVGVDMHHLIYLGVAELVSLGCKRIAYWAPGLAVARSNKTEREYEKNDLWRECVRSHGLEVDEMLLHNRGVEGIVGLSHQEQGFHLGMEVFSQPRSSWPDGILCSDDVMTHGAVLAMEKLRVCIGKDVSVVTHANRNSPVLLSHGELLTRIEFDPSELVHAMFDTLETVMDGGEPAHSVYRVRPVVRRPS